MFTLVHMARLKNVRVDEATHAELVKLADGRPLGQVVGQAVRRMILAVPAEPTTRRSPARKAAV